MRIFSHVLELFAYAIIRAEILLESASLYRIAGRLYLFADFVDRQPPMPLPPFALSNREPKAEDQVT